MFSTLRKSGSHPVRAIREPFGKAGLIVACIALVLGLTGAAFAAGKLTSKQKKEVEKIAKKFQGTGAAGAQGATGAQGPPGAPGANGTDGADGIGTTISPFSGVGNGCSEGGIIVKSASPDAAICNGKKGTTGKSVAIGSEATGTANCEGNGGATVEVSGEASTKKYVCNGAKGATGGFGGQSLTPGVTEKGYWSFSTAPGQTKVWAPISFQQQLDEAGGIIAHYVAGANSADTVCGTGEGGAGGTAANPKAPSGSLCIWPLNPGSGYPQNASFVGSFGQPINSPGVTVNPTGASLEFTVTNTANPAYGAGTWAVTELPSGSG
jgi:hypothetical protein